MHFLILVNSYFQDAVAPVELAVEVDDFMLAEEEDVVVPVVVVAPPTAAAAEDEVPVCRN